MRERSWSIWHTNGCLAASSAVNRFLMAGKLSCVAGVLGWHLHLSTLSPNLSTPHTCLTPVLFPRDGARHALIAWIAARLGILGMQGQLWSADKVLKASC